MSWDGIERRKVDRGGKPPCPKCSSDESAVVDSGLPSTVAGVYERRRKCKLCGHRWTTYEHNLRAERHHIWVEGAQ